MATEQIIGLVLAGGRATRMGGVEKALLPLGGRDLLSHAIGRLAPQCDRIILNVNGDSARFARFGLAVVSDPIEGHAGPLAGLLAGLDWIAVRAPSATALLTVPVDGPFLPLDLGTRLGAAMAADNAPAACARSAGRRHGVYGLWSPHLRDDLRRAVAEQGVRKVDNWLARHDIATVDWSAEPVDPFFNVNTPDDLARAEHLLRAFPDA